MKFFDLIIVIGNYYNRCLSIQIKQQSDVRRAIEYVVIVYSSLCVFENILAPFLFTLNRSVFNRTIPELIWTHLKPICNFTTSMLHKNTNEIYHYKSGASAKCIQSVHCLMVDMRGQGICRRGSVLVPAGYLNFRLDKHAGLVTDFVR